MWPTNGAGVIRNGVSLEDFEALQKKVEQLAGDFHGGSAMHDDFVAVQKKVEQFEKFLYNGAVLRDDFVAAQKRIEQLEKHIQALNSSISLLHSYITYMTQAMTAASAALKPNEPHTTP